MPIDPIPQLPDNSCAYERYDPRTLEPLTAETAIRLYELGWSAKDFSGKTVLDIGCNSGLLTMYALRLGAAKVHACDVQPLLVEFVSQVARARKASVIVTKTAFNDLLPDKDKADIVFFMEVLHWVVSQGLPRRLTELTGELLYIEFPWSVGEPSIQKQTKLTEESYSAEAVLDELTRYFKSVRIVRFMHYFGFKSQSVRVLVEARDKREEAEALLQLADTYSLDRPLSRGRNESYLLTSARGPLVAKSVALESSLSKLPASLVNRLFDELCGHQPKTLVLPDKVRDDYLLVTSGGRCWLTFPFVGPVLSFGKSKTPAIDSERLIDLFLRVRRDLRPVSAEILAALREHELFPSLAAIAASDAFWRTDPGELEAIHGDLAQAMDHVQTLDPLQYDGLCHGDLQSGNFVLGNDGQVKVVDLDNICIAPLYSDGLVGLIWRGFDRATLSTFCDKLGKEEARSVTQVDVTFAIAKSLIWFTAVRPAFRNSEIEGQLTRLVKGLTEIISFAASLPKERANRASDSGFNAR
ncbi:MAG: methyltransferase domain-containing protein [Chthoniobacterales bacterium]|nr:methyltransferase domain-containing protein [Chthoniobacterales bacterium]